MNKYMENGNGKFMSHISREGEGEGLTLFLKLIYETN